MAKRRSGSAATNSASVGGDAPGRANPGIQIAPLTGKKAGKSSRGSKLKSMKQANGITSGIMRPPS